MSVIPRLAPSVIPIPREYTCSWRGGTAVCSSCTSVICQGVVPSSLTQCRLMLGGVANGGPTSHRHGVDILFFLLGRVLYFI